MSRTAELRASDTSEGEPAAMHRPDAAAPGAALPRAEPAGPRPASHEGPLPGSHAAVPGAEMPGDDACRDDRGDAPDDASDASDPSSDATDAALAALAATPARGPRRSLLGKIVVAVSATIFVCAVVALLPLARLYRSQLLEFRREKLDLVTQLLVQKSLADASASRRDLLEVVEENATGLGHKLDQARILVVDHHGVAISLAPEALGSPPGGASLATRAANIMVREAGGLGKIEGPTSSVHGDRLVHLTPIRSPTGFLEGALLIDVPLAPIDRTVATHLGLRMVFLPVLLLVVGVATIAVVYRHVLKPIGVLNQANAALAEGDAVRSIVPEAQIPDDEVGEVIRARNQIYVQMLRYQGDIRRKNKVLEAQRRELEGWNRELEGRVDDKTRELERAQEQLVAREKLAATGSLAAGLAHEINNPLASIAGYAEELLGLADSAELQGCEAFAEFPDALRIIEEQAYRCNKIIRQLMSFARPQPFRAEVLRLDDVVEGVLPLVEHKARGRDVAVLEDLDPSVPPALADRASLEQVLVNLLVNAFDVIEGRTGRITIVTRTLSLSEVAVDVRDTGPGIPESMRRRIFDPFYSTKPVGSGTGLGLWISHALIQRMRGRIEVASAPGAGTTFRVVLPAAPGPAPARRGAAAGDVPSGVERRDEILELEPVEEPLA